MFGWLRRKKPSKLDARLSERHWAQVLTFAQQQRLERLVVEHWQSRYPDVAVVDGVITIEEMRYGLENLSQRCNPIPEDEWALVVKDHFEQLAQSEEDAAEWDTSCETFAWAREHLRVRLYPPTMEGHEMLVRREDLPGVVTALVADRPSSIVSVTTELVEKWQRTTDELFAIALQQTLESEPIEGEWVEFDGGIEGVEPFQVAVMSSDVLLSAGHALAIASYEHLVGEHGTLFAVPNRHYVIAHAIEAGSLPRAVDKVMPLVAGLYSDGPGSITPNLFWRRPDGGVEAQPVELRAAGEGKAKVRFSPSAGFQELVARLLADGDGAP